MQKGVGTLNKRDSHYRTNSIAIVTTVLSPDPCFPVGSGIICKSRHFSLVVSLVARLTPFSPQIKFEMIDNLRTLVK